MLDQIDVRDTSLEHRQSYYTEVNKLSMRQTQNDILQNGFETANDVKKIIVWLLLSFFLLKIYIFK